LISPQVFSSLSGGPVYWDEFISPANWDIEHISLAKKADLVLIAPATANIIGKIASGIADDLLTTTIMTTRAPILIAPSMNENMYKNKIVQANIQKLKGQGFKFIEPTKGKLVCGDVGLGRLAEVETIVKEVKRHL
jgi:phosphopantothenoylcysteine decarboxylase/phosphopantothenate--cysteine ligase